VVDKLYQIDVDIKQMKSRRKCNGFSSLSKVQTMQQFLKELYLKVPHEKEMKMGILFETLLNFVRERVLCSSDEDSDDQ
jgi:hypothetical protein